MTDIDLIKKLPWLPLKLYLNVSNLDDERIMLYYDAINIKGGLEFKGMRNSYFASAILGFYKERVQESSTTGNEVYNNALIALIPGMRWRFRDNMSLVGRAKVMLPVAGEGVHLPKKMIGFSIQWEMPLFFKDTDAEAIRALIYMDRKKTKIKQAADKNPTRGNAISTVVSDSTAGDSEAIKWMEMDYFKRQEELKKRRKQAIEDMKKLEDMIE
jgi:hypothetical protein